MVVDLESRSVMAGGSVSAVDTEILNAYFDMPETTLADNDILDKAVV